MRYFTLCSLLLSLNLFAHPEKLTTITGNQISLHTINHSFSGFIKKRMVQGFKIAGKFESELTILEKDHKYTAHFKILEDGNFGGNLSLPNEKGLLKNHKIQLVHFTREKNEFLFKFGENEIPVLVKSENFDNGHYINPEYSMIYKGEKISFKLEGEACYGYSAHLIAMIMGSYLF